MNDNTIPLVDVTNSDKEQADLLVEARASAERILGTADQFMVITLEKPDENDVSAGSATVAASDEAAAAMTVTMVALVGSALMGDKVASLPPAMARAVCLSAGLQAVMDRIKGEAQAVKDASEEKTH